MHGPDDRLACLQNLTDITQRQHTLVHPMQMDDVGLLKLWQTGDISPCIGDIKLEEPLSIKMQMHKDDQSLPKETPSLAQPTSQSHHGNLVSRLVAH